jgi:phosphatidylinositol-3-phosphatase
VAALLVLAPGSGGYARAPAVPRFSHVVVIVLENRERVNVLGGRGAPYLDSLARRYGVATGYYAIRHPSLPNYLALTGGSTFGIHSDCTSCTVDATNLVDQLERAGISWKAYMEGLPRPCYTGAGAGQYVKKHDPFLYYTDVAGNPARCRKVVPLDQLDADLAAGRLPRFAWISPGLCHDMHDCAVFTGDRFLAGLVPPILRALGPGGVLFLTFDEGVTDRGCCAYAHGGNVATIVAGPLVRPGVRAARDYDHYSLLRTIEDAWGLARLRGAACSCSPPLADFFSS